MKLNEWLQLTGTKQNRLAAAAGMSTQRINRCVLHGMIPHHDEVVKIFWITLGAVRPEDWYDLTAVPAELQRMLETPKKRRKPYVRSADKQQPTTWKRSALDH